MKEFIFEGGETYISLTFLSATLAETIAYGERECEGLDILDRMRGEDVLVGMRTVHASIATLVDILS